ncbi:MAG: hypothetical protein M1831_006474 [Alyxoria varia]|nr:MAG: hypothetical protein M1831_006474 [Alyxoria varia]
MHLPPLSGVSTALVFLGFSVNSVVTAAGLAAMTNKGCFSSAPGLTNQGSYEFQSSGYCQKLCTNKNKPVMALKNGDECYCGDLLPPSGDSAGKSDCDSPCSGYDQDNCGGSNAFQVALTGISSNVGSSQDGGKSGSKSGEDDSGDSDEGDDDGQELKNKRPALKSLQEVTISPSTITAGGSTIVQTQLVSTVTVAVSQDAANNVPTPTPTTAQSNQSNDDEGTSTGTKVGIAVGVVAGILVFAALVFAVWFFMKRRKTGASDHSTRPRRTTSVGSFAAAGTAPSGVKHGNRNIGSSDSRLDNLMVEHRRLSDGSIADNEDYSRRILKVTNPNPDIDRDSMIR